MMRRFMIIVCAGETFPGDMNEGMKTEENHAADYPQKKKVPETTPVQSDLLVEMDGIVMVPG
jgi:hypothetical protein